MKVKIYNINKQIIMVILLNLFIFIGKIEALQITSFTEFGEGAPSNVCSSSFCATEISDSGFRVTLVNSSGVQVANTRIVNFWSTANAANYASGNLSTNGILNSNGYSCDVNFKMRKYNYGNIASQNNPNLYNVYKDNIGISKGQTYLLYKNYFDENTLQANKNRIINIVNELMINGATITDYTNLYLKVEPIYIIKEKYKSYVGGNFNTDITRCNYFSGTTKEIINTWGKAYWSATDNYKEEVTVFGLKEYFTANSLGNSYVYGGCQNGAIQSQWNVVRNFAVSMYYKCGTVGGPTLSSGQCLSDTSLLNQKSICSSSERSNAINASGDINGLINAASTGNGLGVGYFKVSDYVDNCQSRANASVGNKEALTKLYLEYKSKGKDYRNLLNFNNPKCTVKNNCKYSSDVGCFSGNVGTMDNSSDLSCYNDTITAKSVKDNQNVTGYCNVSSKITNLLGEDSFSGISGRMLIKAKEFSNIELELICTFPEKVKSNTILKNTYPLKLSDYLTYKVDNGNEKIKLNMLDSSTDLNLADNSSFYNIKLNGNLYFPFKYAKNGSGEIKLEDCNSCKDLGYGYLTKLDEETGKITFTYKLKTDSFDTGNKTGTCDYTLEPEIIKEDELDIEFRNVDTNTYYFTGVDGNKRLPGKNWSFNKKDKEIDFNSDGIVNYLDGAYFSQIINKEPYTYSLKYDMNKDGILNDDDIMFVNYRINKKKGYQNLLIKHVFENTNNSFDKNKVGPIYKITLTPTDIKSIRKYNETHTYDDYNMECADGINCKSNFLRTYNIQRINISES